MARVKNPGVEGSTSELGMWEDWHVHVHHVFVEEMRDASMRAGIQSRDMAHGILHVI